MSSRPPETPGRDRSTDRRPRLLASARGPAQLLAAAVLAAPLALAWGVGRAEAQDYLGPHQARFASNYSGEIAVDLGPLGNAYLPSPRAPLGLRVEVGGVGGAAAGDSLLSTSTLTAYTSLYADPGEAIGGVAERLADDAVAEALRAELVLVLLASGWLLRRRFLAPTVSSHLSPVMAAAVYLTVVGLVGGSLLAPRPDRTEHRIPVALAAGTSYAGLTVDSVVLAGVLDRGVQGLRVLTRREQRAMTAYVQAAGASLDAQLSVLPRPRSGETMLLGFSDLHCNQAMTQLLTQLARLTRPAAVLSSGDDTVNGTAAERGCVRREAAIAPGLPFAVATGNHDSEVTEAQFRSFGATVLDGSPVELAGLTVLGDDDPERNAPFSVERTTERPELEEQLGQRLTEVARRSPVDVVLVHQPTAANVLTVAPDPPARLVLWGHVHAQSGPFVIPHADGSWTVGMQQGTAGGVRQPTVTSFSTPFSPPRVRADAYCYFRDNATGLITGVQAVHFTPDATVVIDRRAATGELAGLPAETRDRLADEAPDQAEEQPR